MENECLEGVVEEIIYADRSSGYTVCVIDCSGEPVTIVGSMPPIGEGESVRAHGKWVVHPSFGKQFKVEFLEQLLPTTEESILRYLDSGAVKGIGHVLAERIVSRFREETLEVIEHHPDWLSEIRGISPKRAKEIHRFYVQQSEMRETILFFGESFGYASSVRIFKRYGTGAVELVKQNPYRLCEDIPGIGFDKADRFAKSLDIEPNSPDRIRAGLRYILMDEAYQSGHCKLPVDHLIYRSASLLELEESEVADTVRSLEELNELICTSDGEIRYDALPLFHQAEEYIAEKALAIAREKLPFRISGIDEKIADLEAETGLVYDSDQKNAIRMAATHGMTILTGGPGTGKTTIVHALLQIFRELRMSCALAAPTGRAAKRMTETCGAEAKTIHRLLEAAPGENGDLAFKRDEENPLACNVVIIDEMSMVDTLLMEALLRAIRLGTRVILIGDVDQLPPVGPGNCLSALLDCDQFSAIRLTKIHRQAEESMIITNAHRINHGELPEIRNSGTDFFFIQKPDAEQTRDTILSLCQTRLPNRYGIDPVRDIQVVCITRKGPLGTQEMNVALQSVLNPPSEKKRERKAGSRTFRELDKVMQIRNNYDLIWERDGEEGEGVFNGDIGSVVFIDPQREFMRIDFDGRICDYDFSLLDDLELAYAITTHKSQGSEYRFVLIPSFRAPYPLMTRNLLYTAVTRAREMVCLVGDPRVMSQMIQNDRIPVRYSSLPAMLNP